MKKIFFSLLLSFALTFGVSTVQADPAAPTGDPVAEETGKNLVPDSSEVFGAGNGTILNEGTILQDYSVVDDFSKISGGNNDPNYKGAYQIRNIITVIINFLEKMMVPVAIIFLLWSAMRLLIERGNEEQFNQRIRQLIWTGAGFLLFVFAFAIVDYMVFGVQGQVLEGNNIEIFGRWANVEVIGFIKFFSSFVVALAVFYLILGAIQIILLGEQEEQVTKVKRQIVFTVIGILMIAFANTIAGIFFSGNPSETLTVNSTLLIGLLVYWTNIILGFVALGAVIAIIWAGIQMIMHFGNEEALGRSKKIIMYALLGLVLAFSAFTIVRFFLTPGAYSDNDSSSASQLEPFDRGVIIAP